MKVQLSTVLGLAAVACAAPTSSPATSEKRSGFAGGSFNSLNFNDFGSLANFNNFAGFQGVNVFDDFKNQNLFNILQFGDQQLNAQQILQEQQLIQLIQEQLFLQQGQFFVQDNIRQNHFLNRNPNVNTVIQIVQPFVDNSNLNNVNNRFFVRQLQTQPSVAQQVVVVIQDNNPFNIGNIDLIPSAVGEFLPGATGNFNFGTPSLGDYNNFLNQFSLFNGFALCPFGIQNPLFNFGNIAVDPALALLGGQQLFLSFQDPAQQALDDAILQAQIIQAVAGNNVFNNGFGAGFGGNAFSSGF